MKNRRKFEIKLKNKGKLMIDVETIRRNFPYLADALSMQLQNSGEKRIFLDNTASTQLALPVLESLNQAVFRYANIHRGEYKASQETTEEFEKTYNISANLVNADSWREIILGRNTTEMINLVMRCLQDEFTDRDNVVATRLEHNSNYVPWHALQQKLARKGQSIEIRLVDFDKETGELDLEMLGRMVDKRTKLVTVTGASNFMGVKPDIAAIGQIAHSSQYKQPNGFRGSYFLVDAAQLVPGNFVDVKQTGCDFLAWSFHKMGVPLGVGGLYARKELMESFDPFLFGGDMIEDVKEGEVKYKSLPWKYTAGTPNILSTIASGKGISFLINAGRNSLFTGALDAGNAEGKIKSLCEQIETDILLNTPRGDFEIKYTVPKEHQEYFRQHLKRNPELEGKLKDPKQRLLLAKQTIQQAMTNIMQYEQMLAQYTIDRLTEIPNVTLYGPRDAVKRASLVAFNISKMTPQAVAFELNKRRIEVRNGNHCASLAHQYLGLEGTARMSFYIYNTKEEVDQAVQAISEISKIAGEAR